MKTTIVQNSEITGIQWACYEVTGTYKESMQQYEDIYQFAQPVISWLVGQERDYQFISDEDPQIYHWATTPEYIGIYIYMYIYMYILYR